MILVSGSENAEPPVVKYNNTVRTLRITFPTTKLSSGLKLSTLPACLFYLSLSISNNLTAIDRYSLAHLQIATELRLNLSLVLIKIAIEGIGPATDLCQICVPLGYKSEEIARVSVGHTLLNYGTGQSCVPCPA